MKKAFMPFITYLEPKVGVPSLPSPLNLNNVDDFNSCHKDIFDQKNNQFSDYDDDDEEDENDFPYIISKNCNLNHAKSSDFVNIFSFENEPKETINHMYIENDINKEEFSKKIIEMWNLSSQNNKYNNNNELKSISKDDSFKYINNEENNINNNIINESEISKNLPNINKSIIDINDNINKKLKKERPIEPYIEIDYKKEFQLFSKGTNNPYINEIIHFINNKERYQRKLFKTDNYENGLVVKLLGRKRKMRKKRRCEKPVDIRKKLKSRFHKIFTQKMNKNLKEANSEKEFFLMPQIFISNIAKKSNKDVMNMKMKDLLRRNFIEDYKDYKSNNAKANSDKYLKNLNTLDYLEQNVDIKTKSKFNIIGEMKYSELLDEFFYSEEFEKTVMTESKKKSFDYIRDYVGKARTYVHFFLFTECD